jgi:isocitrate dehydrogenase
LADFCTKLEASVIDTVRSGVMTKDLAMCISGGKPVDRKAYATTDEFMNAVSTNFKTKLQGAKL